MIIMIIPGWFWSGSGVRIHATNETAPGWRKNPWSNTGKTLIQMMMMIDDVSWGNDDDDTGHVDYYGNDRKAG